MTTLTSSLFAASDALSSVRGLWPHGFDLYTTSSPSAMTIAQTELLSLGFVLTQSHVREESYYQMRFEVPETSEFFAITLRYIPLSVDPSTLPPLALVYFDNGELKHFDLAGYSVSDTGSIEARRMLQLFEALFNDRQPMWLAVFDGTPLLKLHV